MKKIALIGLALLLCLGTSSPAKTQRKVLPGPKKDNAFPKTEKKVFPQPKKQEDKSYKVCPGDAINIRVYGEADVSGVFTVRRNGSIKYPLLGLVKVEGLTQREIENRLTDLLGKDYLVDPLIYVSLGTYSTQKIFVMGCVATPGPFTFPEGKELTLLQAITQVGGLTRLASVGGVRVIRTDENGKRLAINPRLNDVMNGKRDDIKLAPNDTIIVPERLF